MFRPWHARPTCKATTGRPQRPATDRVHDTVPVPLGGDEGSHRYLTVASFTHKATLRLRTSLHRQLSVLAAQPRQLRSLILIQRPLALAAAALVSVDPVAERAFLDAQIPGHPRDRLAGLPTQPHHALPEVRIELPACLCHRHPP